MHIPLPQCMNLFNAEYPDQFEYMTSRTHEPNVSIATEPEFLVTCSCTDNCTNRSQCECWQLTIQEACAIGETQHSVGYFHHRLRRPQLSAYVGNLGGLMRECEALVHRKRASAMNGSCLGCDVGEGFVVPCFCHSVSMSATHGASVVPSVPTEWSRTAFSIGSKSSGPTQGGFMGGCGQLLASLPDSPKK